MVSAKSVEDQLRKINYASGWNKSECAELPNILLQDEEIFEVVNGWYEGGVALLVATNIRVLLIDKKPLKYLTVEDVRFDTINQIDYSHRMFNASINISAGLKNLAFKSYNQPRLRKLISHVQHRMAELKRMEKDVKAKHVDTLENIDRELKEFLVSQFEKHQSLQQEQITDELDKIKIKNQAEYLEAAAPEITPIRAVDPTASATGATSTELYEDGVKEIFGRYETEPEAEHIKAPTSLDPADPLQQNIDRNEHIFDPNPLKIAYAKLPSILRSKKQDATAISTY